MPTLEEAVATYEQYVLDAKQEKLNETYKYYSQLVAWLRELQERRESDSCDGCIHLKDTDRFWKCPKCKRQYADKYELERRTDADD